MHMSNSTSRILTRKVAVWAMFITSPVIIVFAILGKFDQGIGAWICAGLLAASAIVWWDLKQSVWFWIVIAAASVFQIPFILFVPWTNTHMSFVSLLPFGFLDFIVLYWCMSQVEKAAKRLREP